LRWLLIALDEEMSTLRPRGEKSSEIISHRLLLTCMNTKSIGTRILINLIFSEFFSVLKIILLNSNKKSLWNFLSALANEDEDWLVNRTTVMLESQLEDRGYLGQDLSIDF